MPKVYNYKETEKLVERYATITLEEINQLWDRHRIFVTLGNLTGFGNKRLCTLCKSVNGNCRRCIHQLPPSNIEIINSPCACWDNSRRTYYDIKYAHSPEELLNAYRARAKYLQELMNSRRKKQIKII